MNSKQSRLFCRLDNLTPEMRNEKRLSALKKIGLLEEKVIPIFDEATQTVANFLNTPICILGVMIEEEYCLKSAVGLSKLGLMNQIAKDRKLPRTETFSTYVVDSHHNLIIENTLADSFFSNTNLVQYYGIRAYLGTPLITPKNECIGTLEVFDIFPHQFSQKDIEFLTITARWCLAEYERNQLLINSENNQNEAEEFKILSSKSSLIDKQINKNIDNSKIIYNNELINKLLNKMTQKLSSPLTSIIGMASVLKGEIYGKLTEKQKEYIEIIYNSGQEMNFLVEEIINIEDIYYSKHIQAISVDLQLIAQQVIKNLEYLAYKKEQTLCLSMAPGNRICVLDKQKIKQTIYYIIIAIIEGSQSGGEIQIHISSRDKTTNLTFWVTHPWLGEGISFENIKIYSQIVEQFSAGFSNHDLAKILESLGIQNNNESKNNNFLWLLFAIYLVKLQKGSITFKGSSESGGHRFVINIPLLNE